MIKFLKAFNRPGRFFEIQGYITVVIGLIMFIVGVFNACTGLSTIHSSGAPDSELFSRGITGMMLTDIVAPQLFFAIAKVVKAAEKYLGD